MQEYKLQTQEGKEVIVYISNHCKFDKSLSQLPQGVPLAKLEEFAGVRLLVPVTHSLWVRGMYVAENYNYFPNGDIIIASRDYNPILRNPKKATEAHRCGKEFNLDAIMANELRSIAKEDVSEAIKSGALLVSRKNVKNSFFIGHLVDEAIPYFLFRKNAKAYGELLKEYTKGKIVELPQRVIGEQYVKDNGPFGRSLWVSSLDSALNGNCCFFDNGYPVGRVCGIQYTKATIEEKIENQLQYKTHVCKDIID